MSPTTKNLFSRAATKAKKAIKSLLARCHSSSRRKATCATEPKPSPPADQHNHGGPYVYPDPSFWVTDPMKLLSPIEARYLRGSMVERASPLPSPHQGTSTRHRAREPVAPNRADSRPPIFLEPLPALSE